MKMLLYPFEEQFDVPALSVEFSDCQGFVSQMVCKETITFTVIEGVNHIVNIKSERIFCVQGTDFSNERLTKVSVYTPVPLLICFCKSVP